MRIVLINIEFLIDGQFDVLFIEKYFDEYRIRCVRFGNQEVITKRIIMDNSASHERVLFSYLSKFIELSPLKHFEYFGGKDKSILLINELEKNLYIQGLVQENDNIYQFLIKSYQESRYLCLTQNKEVKYFRLWGCPDSNSSYYICDDKYRSKNQLVFGFHFLLNQLEVAPVEVEFVKTVVNHVLYQNDCIPVLEEYFYLSQTGEMKSHKIYELKKGNFSITLDSYFLPIVQECITEYEKTSGKKLYRVLRGGKRK